MLTYHEPQMRYCRNMKIESLILRAVCTVVPTFRRGVGELFDHQFNDILASVDAAVKQLGANWRIEPIQPGVQRDEVGKLQAVKVPGKASRKGGQGRIPLFSSNTNSPRSSAFTSDTA